MHRSILYPTHLSIKHKGVYNTYYILATASLAQTSKASFLYPQMNRSILCYCIVFVAHAELGTKMLTVRVLYKSL